MNKKNPQRMAHCTRDHKTMTWIVFISRFFYKSRWTAENGLSFYLSLYFEAKEICSTNDTMFKMKKIHALTYGRLNENVYLHCSSDEMFAFAEQIFPFKIWFACTKNSHSNETSMLDSSIIDLQFSLLHFTDFLTSFFFLFFLYRW